MALEVIGAISEIGSVAAFLLSPARNALLASLPQERKSGVAERLRSITTSEVKQINNRVKDMQEESWRSALNYYKDGLTIIDSKFNGSSDAKPTKEDREQLKERLSLAEENAIKAMNVGNKLEKKDGGCPLLEALAIRELTFMLKTMLETDANNKCVSVKLIVDTWNDDIHSKYLYNQKYVKQCLNNNLDPGFFQKLFGFDQKREAFEKMQSLLSFMLDWTVDLARIVGNNKELMVIIDEFVKNIDQPNGADGKYRRYLGAKVEDTRILLRDINYAPTGNDTALNPNRSSVVRSSSAPTTVALIAPSAARTASAPPSIVSLTVPTADEIETQQGRTALGKSENATEHPIPNQQSVEAAFANGDFKWQLMRVRLPYDFLPQLRAHDILTDTDAAEIENKIGGKAQMAKLLEILPKRLESMDVFVEIMRENGSTYRDALRTIRY